MKDDSIELVLKKKRKEKGLSHLIVFSEILSSVLLDFWENHTSVTLCIVAHGKTRKEVIEVSLTLSHT